MKTKIQATSTEDKRKSVLLMGLRIIFYSAVLVGILVIVMFDAQQPILTDKFSEQSYTEYAQEYLLLLAALLFYLYSRLFPKQAGVSFLLGGFLGMAFIREHDAFLDHNVADGVWQVLAYSLAAISAFLAYRHRENFWTQFDSFINARAFGIFVTGLMIVFIFSRLYSNNLIWKPTMGEENYMYVVTRASEEAIELLGYTLILLGSAEYFFFLKTSKTD